MGILGNITIEGYMVDMERDICRENLANHKPTYQDEVDRAKKRCRELYDAGKELIAKINQEDLQRCKKLYQFDHGDYGRDYLVESKILGKRVIVQSHVTLIERVTSLKEILA